MFKFDKNFVYYKLPPVLYALAIIGLSSISNLKPPTPDVPNIDKIYHSIEYFILAFLIFRAFPTIRTSRRKWFLYALLLAFGPIFAAIDETVQSFVPHRDSSRWDWLADVVGYTLAAILFILFHFKRSPRN